MRVSLTGIYKSWPLSKRSLPPSLSNGGGERSSMTTGESARTADTRDPHHAQESTPRLVIVVQSPDSVLPDVLAMHTIEMIPKSMILTQFVQCMVKHI